MRESADLFSLPDHLPPVPPHTHVEGGGKCREGREGFLLPPLPPPPLGRAHGFQDFSAGAILVHVKKESTRRERGSPYSPPLSSKVFILDTVLMGLYTRYCTPSAVLLLRFRPFLDCYEHDFTFFNYYSDWEDAIGDAEHIKFYILFLTCINQQYPHSLFPSPAHRFAVYVQITRDSSLYFVFYQYMEGRGEGGRRSAASIPSPPPTHPHGRYN